MKPKKGYYSLVQFCPDPARAEAVNVGVLLLCQEKHFIDVRMSSNSRRPTKLFGRGNFDAELLSVAKQSIAERVRTERDCLLGVDALQELIDSRGNDIQITKPRAIKVRNPGMDLERLFNELVEPIVGHELSASQLVPRLDEEFHGPRFFGRIKFNQQVHIPVLDNERIFPYAYQNGYTNLILPKRFSDQPKKAKRSASFLGVEGQFLRNHPENGHERRLVVVSAQELTDTDSAVECEVKKVFDELEVEFVPNQELDCFLHRVASEAHVSTTGAD